MTAALVTWWSNQSQETLMFYLAGFLFAILALSMAFSWGRRLNKRHWRRLISDYSNDLEHYLQTRFPEKRFDPHQPSSVLLPVSNAIVKMQQAYHERELLLLNKINALQWKNQAIVNRSRQYSRHLLWLASHDPLTGLSNRVRLLKFMEKQIKRKISFAVLFIDLNEFKKVNEKYSQAVGDLILQEIARRLQQATDKGGCTAHLNSDDFTLITRLTPLDRLEPFIHRLIDSVTRPVETEMHKISVSIAMGVTIFPNDFSSPETLLRHAEQAAYQAKHNTLKCYHLFDVEAERRSRNFKLRYHEIETAFLNGEFEFHYQPKVNMLTGQILGAEALIRWNSPERGMISPAEFIPMIESTDLIHQVGNWVMTNAIMCLNE